MSRKTDPETERVTKVYFDLQAASPGVTTESNTLEDGNLPVPALEDLDDILRTVRSSAPHRWVSNDHCAPNTTSTNSPLAFCH